MVDSGTVNSDSSTISSLFSSYSSETGNLSSSSVWEGESKNNAMNQMKNFVSEFSSPISTQMQSFSQALDKYKTYKQKKRELESTRTSRSNARAANPEADLSSYDSKINSLESELRTLKSNIESSLSSVSSKKLNVTSTTINIDTGSYQIGNFVYYSQGNYKNAYGSHGTISTSGCGPTSVAMVLSTLLGKKITPVETAKYSVSHGYRGSNGTDWGLFPSISKAYGVNCTKTKVNSSNIKSALESGQLLICSMKPGHFTNGGHFIVLKGTKDGKVTVADPNCNKHSGSWPISTIVKECKGMWAFSGGSSTQQTKSVTF